MGRCSMGLARPLRQRFPSRLALPHNLCAKTKKRGARLISSCCSLNHYKSCIPGCAVLLCTVLVLVYLARYVLLCTWKRT